MHVALEQCLQIAYGLHGLTQLGNAAFQLLAVPGQYIVAGNAAGIEIAWNIGNEATAYSGTIKFAITFYKIYYDVDPDTNKPYNFQILYALHTSSATSTVVNGFVYDEEQQKEKDGYYTLSEQHYSTLLAMIDQKNVYWNDL